jgi:hypothetical protein
VVDERARRRIWLAAVAILAISGGVGWLLSVADACDDAVCGTVDLPFVVASLAWIAAAIIALGLAFSSSRHRDRRRPGRLAPRLNVLTTGAGRGPSGSPGTLRAPQAVDRTPIEEL